MTDNAFDFDDDFDDLIHALWDKHSSGELMQEFEFYDAAHEIRARLQREAEEAARRAQEQRSEELVLEVAKVMAGKHRLEMANAIVDGTLHPAITIDWGKVQ